MAVAFWVFASLAFIVLDAAPVVDETGPMKEDLNALQTGKEKTAEAFASAEYWESRYKKGGNSGAGSYDGSAEYKAEQLNVWVKDHNVQTVIEFGCGDGNQLKLGKYLSYIGVDVSDTVLKSTGQMFQNDKTKKFMNVDQFEKQPKEQKKNACDMAMSLDVIYHLVEDPVYEEYMNRLFDSSAKYVAVYATNEEYKGPENARPAHHKHRKFTEWVEKNRPEWKVVAHPIKSAADLAKTQAMKSEFYFFEKEESKTEKEESKEEKGLKEQLNEGNLPVSDTADEKPPEGEEKKGPMVEEKRPPPQSEVRVLSA